ncbi:MAG: hypothetical protein AB1782_19865 [Cyanobacteriota bacterium]
MAIELSEKLEAEFVSLVENSWKIYRKYSWNNSVDEILIGAVIRSSLDKGYLLIDLKSEAPYYYSTAAGYDPSVSGYKQPINKHFLRFENPNDGSRLIYELERITQDLTETTVLGQLSRITIGYGEKSSKFSQVIETLKQEWKTTFVDVTEPGIISFDAEIAAGYIYSTVTIILNIAEYNKENIIGNIDYEKLDYHIEAVVHSLKKYLHGRDVL